METIKVTSFVTSPSRQKLHSRRDSSQKLDPVSELLLARQSDLLEKPPECLPDRHLPRHDDPPVFPVLFSLLIVELDEVPDVEGDEAPFFLDRKGELLAVRFALPL
jgi:hypothetical protein